MRRQQIVVVTGASSGVGRAVARAFGQQQARVALIARNVEALEHAADEIRAAGGEALVLPLDVSDSEAVERAASKVEEQLGPIDVWVNDAMVTVMSPVKEMKPEEVKRVTEVTYLGTVYRTLAALHRMLPRNRGTIIQIGSALAYRSIPLQSAYCASKAAIRGFTDSLRSELLHDKSGVRISMLQLPAVNTPQFDVSRTRMPRHPQPVPPIYQPEVIARAVLYAAKHAPRELWIGGSAIRAIVGQRIFPGLIDRYLARTGYKSQQTNEAIAPDRKDNLFEPVAGDRGAHGDFDRRSRRHSAELWARRHRKLLAATTLVGCARFAAGIGRTKACFKAVTLVFQRS
jgi:NAD(P)-dependent dehydrogenase (short-subunit alcohol dehydrogenase family)